MFGWNFCDSGLRSLFRLDGVLVVTTGGDLLHAADRTLARRVAKGDEAAFRDFFTEYYPKVFRFSARRMAEDEAEEVAQQVFMEAIRAISGYRGEASLFTWLCQIARFQIAAYYRRRERTVPTVAIEDEVEFRAELESFVEAEERAPEFLAIAGQAQELVEVILDHLPSDYGRILEWKYMEGLSVEEIARRLGVTLVSVQSKLARARDAFRAQYNASALRLREIASPSGRSES